MEPVTQVVLSEPASQTKADVVASVRPAWVSESKPREFNHRLEAVRGVAAMMVAAGHSILILPAFGWQGAAVPGLQLLMNGRAAVTLFFVLSGLVLGMSLRRSSASFPIEASTFYIRRFLRIYPAFFVCTVVILLYVSWRGADDAPAAAGSSFDQLYGAYRKPLTPARILANLYFSGNSYNGVIWTLKIEMICSLCLPLVHRIVAGASGVQRWVIFAGFLGMWLVPKSGSLGYLFMFFAGYMLPVIGPDLFVGLRKSRTLALSAFSAAVPVMLCSRLIGGTETAIRLGVVIEALAATILIGALLYGNELKIYRSLDHPIARFYGRISYSFYLWHMFCLLLVSNLLLEVVPKEILWQLSLGWAVVLWGVSTLVATGISLASYHWVEKPLIELSKRICRWISLRATLQSSLQEPTSDLTSSKRADDSAIVS